MDLGIKSKHTLPKMDRRSTLHPIIPPRVPTVSSPFAPSGSPERLAFLVSYHFYVHLFVYTVIHYSNDRPQFSRDALVRTRKYFTIIPAT